MMMRMRKVKTWYRTDLTLSCTVILFRFRYSLLLRDVREEEEVEPPKRKRATPFYKLFIFCSPLL